MAISIKSNPDGAAGSIQLNGVDVLTVSNSGISTGSISANTLSGSLNANNLVGALPALDGSSLTGVTPETRTVNTGVGLLGGNNLSSDITISVDFANTTNILSGTSNKVLEASNIYTASAPIQLTDSANIAVDMAAGRIFTVTLAGNRTLDNPTNQVPGQSGAFIIKQDSTGSRTLSYGSDYKFSGGAPTLSTAANTTDVISYYVEANSSILCTFSGEFS